MHFLLTTMWTKGDVIPFVRLGRALVKRGHRATLVTHEHFRDLATTAGLGFEPIDEAEDFGRLVADNPFFNTPQGFVTIYQRHVLPKIAREYAALAKHARLPGCVVVTRSTPALGARLVAETLGTPFVPVFLAPSFVTNIASVEQLLGNVLAAEINSVRRGLGLAPVSDWAAWLATPSPSVGLWPEWFAPADAVAPPGLVLSSFLNAAADGPQDALPEIDRSAPPPILITGGTGLYLEQGFFSQCIDACAKLGRSALVLTQHAALLPDPLPAHCRWLGRYVEFAQLMPCVAAVVHHGGIGTIGEAVAAGCPQLVMGTGADRPDNAAHLVRLGLAAYVPPPRWSVDAIAKALATITSDASLRERCSDAARRVRAFDVTGAVCGVLEAAGAASTALRTGTESTAGHAATRPDENARAPTAPAAPTAASQRKETLERKLEQLSPAKRALLERKLAARAQANASNRSIQPLLPDAPAPLSFAQQRLWFLDEFEPGSAAYILPLYVRLVGPLVPDALEKALRDILRRHEVLRTSVGTVDGVPVLRVRDPELTLERVKTSREDVAAVARAESRRPFDLSEGALLRGKLLVIDTEEHVLLVTMHHIASDGWSLGIVVRELALLYGSFARGAPSTLPEPTIQYRDYAAWQRSWLAGPELEKQLEFFRKRLANAPTLDLPTDRPRPPVQSVRGAHHLSRVPESARRALNALALDSGTTLYMVLLSAFASLLSRYSGQDDIVLGTPIANRRTTEVESLVGLFANTLVLRIEVPAHGSFRALLDHVKQVALSTFEHQDIPFEKVVDALQPDRSLDRSPLFQVMFSLQSAPDAPVEGGVLKLVPLEFESGTSKLDLTLTTYPAVDGDGMFADWEFNTDLFDAETIRRMAAHFEVLLRNFAADPETLVERVELLTTDERRRQLVDWNRTHTATDDEQDLVALFEASVARHPTTVAVRSNGESLTYRELSARVAALTDRLREAGVGTETIVGLYVERSLAMLVSLLAVLKAGGAYLPLDPAYPPDRVRYMLEHSGARVLCTTSKPSFPLPPDVVTVALGDLETANACSPVSEAVRCHPHHLAYVIYTSGSTGRPKGVEISRRALVNLLFAMRDEIAATEKDVLLAVTSLSFDIAALELFLPLVVGAELVIANREDVADGARLSSLLGTHGATLMQATPSTWSLLVEAGFQSPGLTVLCGGEALPAPLAPELRARAATVLNVYGPTETTVWSATYRLPSSGEVLVGRPLRNTDLFVLDRHGAPVPVGVPGELFIGGAGVARGYRHSPDLTAERFVPSPFAATAGERMYRTGDLVRYRSDGNVEFLGRLDHQVKIRGHRIELGEIEAALARHPDVKDAVVVARDDKTTGKRLVAFLIMKDGGAPDVTELRGFVRQQLPDYMVPSAFVAQTTFPLTPNKKIDRRALASQPLVGERLRAVGEIVLPRTPHERALAALWGALLDIERVGLTDNFFELGGDSILTIQLVARAKALGIPFSPKDVFAHQTLEALAAVTAPRVAADDDATFALTAQQRRTLACASSTAPPIETAHITLAGALSDAAVLSCLSAVVARNDALRLRVVRAGEGVGDARIVNDATCPFDVIVLTGAAAAAASADVAIVARVAEERLRLSGSDAPLFRALLFREPTHERSRLVLVAHAVAVDTASWRTIVTDLDSALARSTGDAPIRLPRNAALLKPWVEQANARGATEAVNAQLPFWGSRPWSKAGHFAREVEAVLASARFDDAITVTLPAAETRALLDDAAAAYRLTMDEVLLTAVGEVVATHVGARVVVIEVSDERRDDPTMSPNAGTPGVGAISSVFPLAFELARGDRGDRIKRTKESLRATKRRGATFAVLAESADGEMLKSVHAELRFRLTRPLSLDPGNITAIRLTHDIDPDPGGPWLDVEAVLVDGALQLHWTFARAAHRRETIDALATSCIATLREMLEHCRQPGVGALTPSDFELARLSQSELDRVTRDDPRNVEDIYPLSPMQAGMLFHSSETGTGAYVEQTAFAVEGDLDPAALDRAFATIVARHVVFRTSVHWDGFATPFQVVHRSAKLPVEVTKGSAEELDAVLAADRARGFVLEHAPLARFLVVQHTPREWQCVFSSHHLILDGWSMSMIFGELFALYESERGGATVTLSEPGNYRDYIAALSAQSLEAAEGYWRRALAGFVMPTPLAIMHAATAEASYAEADIELSAADLSVVTAFSRKHQLTLNTLASAAFAIVLARYSGENDVVFGATVSGRSASIPHVESLVGLLSNTLPVRARMTWSEAVLPWLTRLQASQREARDYEYAPLVQVQSWSEVPRGRALFDSIFVFENYPIDRKLLAQEGSLKVRAPRLVEQTDYALTFYAYPNLLLRALYDRARFDEAAVSRMLGHVRNVVLGLCGGAARLSDVALLEAAERHTVVTTWNDTQEAWPAPDTLHELFVAQARQTPDRVCLVSATARVTYRAVDEASNRLARYLQRAGVTSESRVGVCLERTPEAVIVLLAILKAGAAFVAFDATYPRERLAFMIADSQLSALVTRSELASALPHEGTPLVLLDRVGEQVAAEDGSSLRTSARASSAAYVIYTSGSTGRPKGVIGTHGASVNRLRWSWKTYPFAGDEVCIQKTSPNFVDSIAELFAPLLAGVPIAIARPDDVAGPDVLVAFIEQHHVTRIVLVPSLLRVILDVVPDLATKVPRLRYWTSSGEALPAELATRFVRALPDAVLVNIYGSSEVAADSTFYEVPGDLGATSIPLGRPLANTRAYVLDAVGEVAPVGVRGELYIAGDGVARGYLGRPDLTAERFLPDHVSGPPGSRMYRTGDTAVYRADGAIDYRGRSDHQVKIRGMRVELSEIEGALRTHPEVAQAVVMAKLDSGGDAQLIAYVVTRGSEAITQANLAQCVRAHVPEYMVPSSFVQLPTLPLNPSGKIDRLALLAIDASRPAGEAFVAPSTAAERVIAKIWIDILGVSQVSVDDNFFTIGGHSLRAMQLVSRLRMQFRVEVPVRAVFDALTIRGLVEVLGQAWESAELVEEIAQTILDVDALDLDEVQALLDEE